MQSQLNNPKTKLYFTTKQWVCTY